MRDTRRVKRRRAVRDRRAPADPELTAYPSFQRFRVPLVGASVALVLCAVVWPVVVVAGPDVFGRGPALGWIVLAVLIVLIISLAVLFVWGFSVGGRPWGTSPAVAPAQ